MFISFYILNTSLRLSLTWQKRNRASRSCTLCSNSQNWWVTELRAKLRLLDFRMCALERGPNPFPHTVCSHPRIVIPNSWVWSLLLSSFSPHSYWHLVSPQGILPPTSWQPHHFHIPHVGTEEELDGGNRNLCRLMTWFKGTSESLSDCFSENSAFPLFMLTSEVVFFELGQVGCIIAEEFRIRMNLCLKIMKQYYFKAL